MPQLFRSDDNRACVAVNNQASDGILAPCIACADARGMPRCLKVATNTAGLGLDEGVATVDGFDWPEEVFLGAAQDENDLPYGNNGAPNPTQQCLGRCMMNWLSVRPVFGAIAANQFVEEDDDVYTRIAFSPWHEIRIEYSYDSGAAKYRRRVFWAADNRILFFNVTEQDDPFDCFASVTLASQFESGDLGTVFDTTIYHLPDFLEYGGGGACIVSATGGELTIEPWDCCACECVGCSGGSPQLIIDDDAADPLPAGGTGGAFGSVTTDTRNGDGDFVAVLGAPNNACRVFGGSSLYRSDHATLTENSHFTIQLVLVYRRESVFDEGVGGFVCKWVLELRYIWYAEELQDVSVHSGVATQDRSFSLMRSDLCWWRYEAPDARCPPASLSDYTLVHAPFLAGDCPAFVPVFSGSGPVAPCDKTRCDSACDAVGTGDVLFRVPQCMLDFCVFHCVATPPIITLTNVVPCDSTSGNPTWEGGPTGQIPFDCTYLADTRTCGIEVTLEYTGGNPFSEFCWLLGFVVFDGEGGHGIGSGSFLNIAIEGVDDDGALIIACCDTTGVNDCATCFVGATEPPGPCDDGLCGASCDDSWADTLVVPAPACVAADCIGTPFNFTGFVVDADCASGVVTFLASATVDGCAFSCSVQQVAAGGPDTGCWWIFFGGPGGKFWTFKSDKLAATLGDGTFTCCDVSGGATCTGCDPINVTV